MLNHKNIAGVFAVATLLIAAVGCNSSMPEYEKDTISSSTMVTSFTISQDKKVLANIDSVFFTIDLQKSLIYNADSLPYGTDVSHLVPVIKTYAGVSAAMLSFPRENKPDSVVDYLKNSTDSIDFSRGPVTLQLLAMDGVGSQTYKISVNVHKVKPDSLVWNRMQRMSLPSTFKTPTAQGTVYAGGTYICITKSGNNYCIATADEPATPSWSTKEVTLPFVPRLETLRALDATVCVLAEDGTLYTSADKGITWSTDGSKFHWLYGQYGSSMLASSNVGGKWQVASWPGTQTADMPEGMPVSGTSLPLVYTFEMSTSNQMLMTGGRTASGELCRDTWGYDGTTWAPLSMNPLPAGIENMALAPYFTVRTNTSVWTTTRYSTLVALGGTLADGSVNTKVYTSVDFGVTWREAGILMQLPSYVPATTMAQAFTHNSTMHSRSGALAWLDIPTRQLPPAWSIIPTDLGMSRATTPITEWECPYIYVFGGYDSNGVLSNNVWRAVINRFTFKPIQ